MRKRNKHVSQKKNEEEEDGEKNLSSNDPLHRVILRTSNLVSTSMKTATNISTFIRKHTKNIYKITIFPSISKNIYSTQTI